jgi:hypothetical protein
MATLKQRGEKAARGSGRAPSGVVPHRLVPLSDPQYMAKLEIMVATLKIPLERRNPDTGRTEKVRLWTVTDRTVRTWLYEAAAGDATHIPAQLRHAHAVCGHFAEGVAEPDAAQKHEVHRSLHEGVCAGRSGEAQGAVPYAGQ